ncbi:MAG: hypothetical protein Q9182_004612 [Xanthomendoza sp. 2 TL-2023]
MPKALTAKDDNARVAPYSKSKPSKRDSKPNADKENTDATTTSKPKLPKAAAEIQQKYGDFRDIPLEEYLGEVPCYDDCTTVRRKLNKLLTDKQIIPGTNKKWTQAGMSKEMEGLEDRMGAVKYHKNSIGPSVRSLGAFLKKKGKMGGGDSPAYYWGYVLCEKLRIWEGTKKTKAREEAERTMRNGHQRWDPSTVRLWTGPGMPMFTQNDLANEERSARLKV